MAEVAGVFDSNAATAACGGCARGGDSLASRARAADAACSHPAGEPRSLVIGATGLVGSALMRVLEARSLPVLGTTRGPAQGNNVAFDLRNPLALGEVFATWQPQVVYLPAALTNVDYCEQHPDEAGALNVAPVGEIARLARQHGALLVYFSTDYVFDGAEGPYDEQAAPNPLSVYGRTKLAAERTIEDAGGRHLILRTTVVYGWDPRSKNAAMQVWRRLSAGQRMQVASDQLTTPTLVESLAETTLKLVQVGAEGIVNVVGQDLVSRADFAVAVAQSLGLDPTLIEPVPTSRLRQAAPRPLKGGLTTQRLERLLGARPIGLDASLHRLRRSWRAEMHPTMPRGAVPATDPRAASLRGEILDRVRAYHALVHEPPAFVPFRSRVHYAGRVFGAEELLNATEAVLEFSLTLGRWGDLVERKLRGYLGARDVALVNSGSSANLAAVATLCSPLIERPLRPGDEVITPATTFPTTLAPLVQHGLVPVFVDVEIGTYNVNPSSLEAAVSPRTRALMLPHTLGNPFNLDVACELARRHSLYLVEDACDALGSEWSGRRVGTFGDLGTLSFYPAHHITMGEGGAVLVNHSRYVRVVRSVRDWGRDCWCPPAESNTCGKRFGWSLGALPAGYDHKYTYSQPGYNLKPTDLQAAIGAAQVDRLDAFIAARRRNFHHLYQALQSFAPELVLPRAEPQANPAWFGFPVTVSRGVSKRALVGWLEEAHIETRDLFGGNILRQPGYRDIRHRVAGSLEQSDRIMRDTFFVGVYPGLTEEMLDFVAQRFRAFFDAGLHRRSAAA